MNIYRRKHIQSIALSIMALLIPSCRDSDDRIQPVINEGFEIDGALSITFDNVVNDQNLILSDQTYGNRTEETYEVTELKYIISNIRLTRSDGTVFTYPVADSYFVIDESERTSLKIDLKDIPNGRYTQLLFGFGVDQNNYPIEQGTLNFIPTAKEKGMLWAWAAGYKFLKMEGNFRASGSDISELFTYHIGSLSNTLDNYKDISLPLAAKNKTEASALIEISADIAQVFDATHTISIKEKSDIQIDPENSPKIAENVSTMFRIK